MHSPQISKRIVDFCRERYNTDKATYHVSATLESVPGANDLDDPVELEKTYLERWSDVSAGKGFTAPGRQILHCTFGSVLTHPELGKLTRDLITAHPDTYTGILAEHFVHHLRALSAGM